MTNDMIAMASIWGEEKLRPPKCNKEDHPQVLGFIFPSPDNLNPKAMITYKRP